MDPLYLEERIKTVKNNLMSNTKTSPFELHRQLVLFEEKIQTQVELVKQEMLGFQKLSALNFQEVKRGVERLQEIAFFLRNLHAAATALEDLNSYSTLSEEQQTPVPAEVILINTSLLKDQISQVQKNNEETLRCFNLLFCFLCHKEADHNQIISSRSPDILAGQYLYMCNGDIKKAKTLLLDMLETLYAMSGEAGPYLPETSFCILLEALCLLAQKRPANLAPSETFVIEEKEQLLSDEIIRPEQDHADSPVPTAEASTETEESALPENQPVTSFPTEQTDTLLVPAMENSTPQPESAKEAARTDPESKGKKTITIREYQQYSQEYENLKNQFNDAIQRRNILLKEMGSDITDASKEQTAKLAQLNTAIEDVEKRMTSAGETVNKLNEAILRGEIELQKKTSKRAPHHLQQPSASSSNAQHNN